MEILGCILTMVLGLCVFLYGSVLLYASHMITGKFSDYIFLVPIALGCFIMYYGFHSLPFDIVRK